MRVVRLLGRLGFNAQFGLTGTLNSRREVHSKPSLDDRFPLHFRGRDR